jgi:hypothetical protein
MVTNAKRRDSYKLYYKKNRTRRIAYFKKYNKEKYPDVREKKIATVKKWRMENPEKRTAYNKKYYQKNKEKAKAYGIEWRKKNKTKIKANKEKNEPTT